MNCITLLEVIFQILLNITIYYHFKCYILHDTYNSTHRNLTFVFIFDKYNKLFNSNIYVVLYVDLWIGVAAPPPSDRPDSQCTVFSSH